MEVFIKMTATFVNVALPQDLYSQLESAAKQLEKSAETLLTETLQLILATNSQFLYQPKPEGEIPDTIRNDIASLEMYDTDELKKIAASEMSLDNQDRMEELSDLQKQRTLTSVEADMLEQMRLDYGHVMLRKARAFALLADRGYPLPAY